MGEEEKKKKNPPVVRHEGEENWKMFFYPSHKISLIFWKMEKIYVFLHAISICTAQRYLLSKANKSMIYNPPQHQRELKPEVVKSKKFNLR